MIVVRSIHTTLNDYSTLSCIATTNYTPGVAVTVNYAVCYQPVITEGTIQSYQYRSNLFTITTSVTLIITGRPNSNTSKSFYCIYHYRKQGLCRVQLSLPRAKSRALDKELFYRVPHSATIYTRQRRLCRVSGTRQSQTLGKDPFCRVSGTRQTLPLGKKRRQVTAAVCHPGLPSARP